MPTVSAQQRTASPEVQAQLLARIEQYRPYLNLLARVQVGRRLQGKVDPDDLVQETFLAAIAGGESFRGHTEAELTAWLSSILLSRVLKCVERYFGTIARDVRKEIASLLDSSADSLNGLAAVLPGNLSTPSKAAQRRERAVVVAETLNRMSPEHRDVLILRNIEGLTFPEIAERLNRSVGAVTMLWTRAVRQFQKTCPVEP